MPPRMLFKEHRAPFVAEHRAAFQAAAEAWDASLAPAPAEEGLYETWGNDICHHYTPVGELVGEEANRIEDLNAKNRLKEYIEKRATHRDMAKHRYLDPTEPSSLISQKSSYRHQVAGIVPGYTGYKPRDAFVVGHSSSGFTGAYDQNPRVRAYGQYKGDVPPAEQSLAKDPVVPQKAKLVLGPQQTPVMPGCSTFVSKRRETYGASPFCSSASVADAASAPHAAPEPPYKH